MKILIGICGIGNGHLSRQTNVIEYLLQSGHNIVIATTNNNIKFFKKKFPSLNIINIHIPWIICNVNGINFKDSLQKYKETNIDYYKIFLEFSLVSCYDIS